MASPVVGAVGHEPTVGAAGTERRAVPVLVCAGEALRLTDADQLPGRPAHLRRNETSDDHEGEPGRRVGVRRCTFGPVRPAGPVQSLPRPAPPLSSPRLVLVGDGGRQAGGRETECGERHGVERQLGVQVGQVGFEQLDQFGRLDLVGGSGVGVVGADGGSFRSGSWCRGSSSVPGRCDSGRRVRPAPAGMGRSPAGAGCAGAHWCEGELGQAPRRRWRSSSASLSTKKSPLSCSTARRIRSRLAEVARESDAHAAVEPLPSGANACTDRRS